ncbi:unnamed protein product [Moneuplotes crassus]|uniref:Cyclic nucleotide-binding domain-containing protein n=1 Tax=Euplotes crassus TaxID=5936 RepID=A0AAD1Y264_EUPCR|nr:unnamed protein product [Moneuplotes crassus]
MEKKVHPPNSNLNNLNIRLSKLDFLKSVKSLRKESVVVRKNILAKAGSEDRKILPIRPKIKPIEEESVLPCIVTSNCDNERNFRLEYIKTLTSKFILSKIVSIGNIKLEQNLLRVLRIPENDRTDDQIYKLKKELKRFSFFAEYVEKGNEDLVGKCAKVMTLEEYKPNKIVFNYGEIGTKFYLIIKGSVNVLIPCTQKFDLTYAEYVKFIKEHEGLILSVNGVKFFSYPYPCDRVAHNPIFKEANEVDSYLVDKLLQNITQKELRSTVFSLHKKFKDKRKDTYILHYLTCVKTLKSGDQFGELALLNSKPRAATIMTVEDTSLAVLSKKGFDRNLKNSENTKLEREIKELNNFGIFKNLTRTSKSKLVKCIVKEEIKKGQYLCKENEENVYLYIIKEGKFEIQKELSINLDTGMANYTPLYLSTRELKKHKDFFGDYKCLINGNVQIGNVAAKPKSLRSPRIKKKLIKLSSISDGHVIGLNDYLFRSSHKFFSVKCTSSVAQVARMHINDIAANLNTLEVSQEMKVMVYKNLSILGESLTNSLKLENVMLLNSSKEEIPNKEEIPEISRNLEEHEEHVFYQRLKSMNIVNPVKNVAVRHKIDGKKDPKTIFYRQLCIEDYSTALKRINSPEPKIKDRLFTQPLEDLFTSSKKRIKTIQKGSRNKIFKTSSLSSIRQKSVATLPVAKISVAPANFMFRSPTRSQNYHKVIFDRFGKTVIKTALKNKKVKKKTYFAFQNHNHGKCQCTTKRESILKNLTISRVS